MIIELFIYGIININNLNLDYLYNIVYKVLEER